MLVLHPEVRWDLNAGAGVREQCQRGGQGTGTRSGSHRLPRERKLGHSSASLSQRKPSAWDVALPQDAGAILGGWGCCCTEPVPPGDLNAGLMVPGLVSPWRDEHHQGYTIMGTCHMPPCCFFFSFSILCAPFAHAGGSCLLPMGPSGDPGMWLVTVPERGPGGLCLPQCSTMTQKLPAAPASMK